MSSGTLVFLMTCMSGGQSHKKKCLSDSLEQQNTTTFVDCFRKGLGECRGLNPASNKVPRNRLLTPPPPGLDALRRR